MKKTLFTLAFTFSFLIGNAQQETMYTHYLSNRMAINPGFTGTKEGINIFALHRSQWVAFNGAPNSQLLSVSFPFERKNIGTGITFENDRIGPISNLGIGGSFAYHIKVNQKSKLSLGLSARMNVISAGLTNLETVEQNDVAFSENISSRILPNFGLGAYYYSDKFYVGISAPKILQNGFYSSITTASVIALTKMQRHYYLVGGSSFTLDKAKNLELKPSALLKVTAGAPIQLTLSSRFVYQKKYSAGIMWRSGDAIGILIGMQLFDNFQFGYSYDWSYTNKTFRYNGGSHEIILKYSIPKKKNRASI